jgi:hypothetical protein
MPFSDLTARRRNVWRLIISVAAVISAMSMLLSVLLYEQGIGRDKQTHVLAVKANRLAVEIQNQRVMTIEYNCLGQNKRNHETIKTLHKLYHNLPQRLRTRAKTGRDNTIALIHALVPLQDCKKVVNQLAPTPPPHTVPDPTPTPTESR